MTRKKFTVSVAIPTYESGKSLVKTVETILQQTAFSRISRILVVVDGKKMSPLVRRRLSNEKTRIIQMKERFGQSRRLQDIFYLSNSDLLVVTNDDVLLKRDAIEEIIRAFEVRSADLLSASVTPVRGKTFLREILSISYDINKKLIRLLHFDTYLTTNGRFIALSKRLYKSVIIPEKLQNNDAFLYFFTRLNNYKHFHVEKAEAFFYSPKTLAEHVKQSGKFQRSQKEIQQFFKLNMRKYYEIPKMNAIYAFLFVFAKNPILAACYAGVHGFSRVFSEKTLPQSGIWQTDASTKLEE